MLHRSTTASTLAPESSPAGDQTRTPDAFTVGDAVFPAWPNGQSVQPMSASLMAMAVFDDHSGFETSLVADVLAAEQSPRFRGKIFKGGCGVKVRAIPEWESAAASLIHARALMLAHRTLSGRAVFADDTWASVYRHGDYCMPHSHLRSNASIVYMLDPGDEPPEDDTLSGRLCFADPRIDACCPHEAGRVTQHVMPTMNAGTMLIFASDYLHNVNPYYGVRPRITLSWNITLERLPGRAGEGWM